MAARVRDVTGPNPPAMRSTRSSRTTGARWLVVARGSFERYTAERHPKDQLRNNGEDAVERKPHRRGTSGVAFLRDGAVTAAALLLVFVAFDDITTDNATAFPVEYTFLVGCAAWLLVVAWRLLHARHRALGGVSVLAVAAGVVAQRAIGPGIKPGLWPEYVVMAAAYLWFWGIAVAMLWLGYCVRRQTV